MSRIGKKPVKVPKGVKVELTGNLLKIASAKEALSLDIHPVVKVAYDAQTGEIVVTRIGDEAFSRAMHGTTRAHIANMIEGVTKGFAKKMQIFGTGYGAKLQGKQLSLTLGYAKPALVTIPEGITIDIETPNARGNEVPAVFTIKGPDKCLVGQVAAAVRKAKPPEPYKGKGVRYADEVVQRKVGKAFATGG